MFKRKRKLIDKKFQLKSVFIILIVSTISIFLIAGIMFTAYSYNNRTIQETLYGLGNAIEIENNIVEAFVDYQERITDSPFRIKNEKIKNDHEKSIEQILQHVSALEIAIEQNRYIIFIAIALIALQCIFFCLYMIRYTHRIAGPVHVITKYIKEMADGKTPTFRPLRDKDELQELYDNLIKMARNLK